MGFELKLATTFIIENVLIITFGMDNFSEVSFAHFHTLLHKFANVSYFSALGTLSQVLAHFLIFQNT